MAKLKIKYKRPAIMPGSLLRQSTEVDYVGYTVPRQSWLKEHEFFLATGDMDAPVRILDKRNIIQAWIDKSNRQHNVTIVDNKYVVTAGPFNRYSCTCTAYKYRNKCSHIDGVKRANP